MIITTLLVGKTTDNFIKEGIDIYIERIKHHLTLNQFIIPDLKDRKNLSRDQIREKEASAMTPYISKSQTIILLDEKGTEFRSKDFAIFIQKQMNSGVKEVVFIVGGAYGIDESIRKQANHIISLSKMTFTHQFIRLMFFEQLYRAFSIINHEPYHNE